MKSFRIDDLSKLPENTFSDPDRFITTNAFGSSMQPTINAGDRITIDTCQNNQLSVNEIIVFACGSQLTCHRIKEIKEGRNGGRLYITQGDSHHQPDKIEVEQKFIAGKVVKIIKKKGDSPLNKFFLALRNRLAKILDFFKIKNACKKIIVNFYSNRINYSFRLPRKVESFPMLRFIEVPLEDILQRDKDFFAPLNDIGSFRISAQIKKEGIAEVEVSKLNGTNHWAITLFQTKSLFSGTRLETMLFDHCHKVLAFLDKNDLRFTANGNQTYTEAFEKWNMGLLKKEGGNK